MKKSFLIMLSALLGVTVISATNSKPVEANATGATIRMNFESVYNNDLKDIAADGNGNKEMPVDVSTNLGDGTYGTYLVSKGGSTEKPKMRLRSADGKYYLYLKYSSLKTVGALGAFIQFNAKPGWQISTVYFPKPNSVWPEYSYGTYDEVNDVYTEIDNLAPSYSGNTMTFSTPASCVRIYHKPTTEGETPTHFVPRDYFDITFVEDTSEKHSITYDSNGGSNVTKQYYDKDDLTVAPTNPTKDDSCTTRYTFAGWYEDNSTFLIPFEFGTKLTEDKTLYAKWTESEITNFTVSTNLNQEATKYCAENQYYYFNDSSIDLDLYKSGTVDSNFTITAFGNGSAGANNVFLRKYSSPASYLQLKGGSKGVNFNGSHILVKPVSTNNYIIDSVRLLDLNGSSKVSTVNSINYRYSLDNITFVEVLNCSFVNNVFETSTLPKGVKYLEVWVDSIVSTATDFIANIEVDYSKFVGHTLSFNTNGGTEISPVAYASDEVTVKPTDPTKASTASTRYTFDKWCSDPELTIPFVFGSKLTENKTIYAKWTEESLTCFKVHFDLDGGQGDISDVEITPGELVTKPSVTPTKVNTDADAFKLNYQFSKWINEDGTAFNFNVAPTSDITIKAEYKKIGYCPSGYTTYSLSNKVKEYAADWTEYGDHDIDTQTMTGQTSIQNLNISFKGHVSGSSGVKHKDATSWELLMYNAKATISLSENSGKVITGFRFESVAETYYIGHSQNVYLKTSNGTVLDYELSPYDSNNVVLTAEFDAKDLVTEVIVDFPTPKADTKTLLSFKKLYVQYADAPTVYTVTYNANGAAGTVPTDSNKYVANEKATVLAPSALTNEGYKFVGWGDDPTNPTVTYAAGDEITMTENVTLYALWEFELQDDLDKVACGMKLGFNYTKTVVKDSETTSHVEYTNDSFRIQVGIDGMDEFVGAFNEGKTKHITDYGIMLVKPNATEATPISFVDNAKVFKEGTLSYSILNFGAAMSTVDKDGKMTRMGDKITIYAYVVFDGKAYYSAKQNTKSIADLVEIYYSMPAYQAQVAELYNILVEQGYIVVK